MNQPSDLSIDSLLQEMLTKGLLLHWSRCEASECPLCHFVDGTLREYAGRTMSRQTQRRRLLVALDVYRQVKPGHPPEATGSIPEAEDIPDHKPAWEKRYRNPRVIRAHALMAICPICNREFDPQSEGVKPRKGDQAFCSKRCAQRNYSRRHRMKARQQREAERQAQAKALDDSNSKVYIKGLRHARD